MRSSAVGLEFVGRVRAELEFHLQPDGMVVAKVLAMVVIVLQPELGELARVKGQSRRDARPVAPELVRGVNRALVAGNKLAAQAADPALHKAPGNLRVKSPVGDVLRGQRDRHARAGEAPGTGARAATAREPRR